MADDLEPISSWLQLTDCSDIMLFAEVDEALREIFPDGAVNLDVDGPWWNQDNSRPMRLNVFVTEGITVDFTELLDRVSALLRQNEFLLFQEMQRYEHVGGAACSTIIVAKDHVERVSSQGSIDYLRNRAHIPDEPDSGVSPDVD